jgi:hypothetical protein
MPKQKHAKNKVTRSFNKKPLISRKLPSRLWMNQRPLLFAVIFAFVGGIAYLAVNYAAAPLTLPTGANDLVMEYHLPEKAHQTSADIPEYEAPAALLYGDGRLLCGSDSTSNPTKTNAGHLTATQTEAFVDQLKNIGFLNMQPIYSTKKYRVDDFETQVLLNFTSGSRTVAYMDGPKPVAFSQLEQAVNNLCQQNATLPYEPDSVGLNIVKQPSPESQAQAWTGPDVLKDKNDFVNLSGVDAKKTVAALKTNRQKVRSGKTYYQVAVQPIIPNYKLPVPAKKHSVFGFMGFLKPKKAYADGNNTVIVYSYNGGCSGALGATVQNMAGFWDSRVGKNVTVINGGVLNGPDPGSDAFGAWDNMWNWYSQPGTNKVFLMNHGFNGSYEGVGGNSPSSAGWNNFGAVIAGLGIVSPNRGCGSDLYNSIAAHETGHGFGAGHVNSCTIMYPSVDSGGICGYHFSNVPLDSGQAAGLYNSSPFFHAGSGGVSNTPPPPPPNRIDYFVTGTNQQLYHKWYSDGSGWSGYEPLGESIVGTPAAVSWGVNRVDAFFTGAGTNYLFHKWWDGSRWIHEEVPTPSGHACISGSPAASSWGSGRIDVFVRGCDSNMYHAWYSNGWHGWESLGAGSMTSSPAAASWGANRIDVVYAKSDNQLWHIWFDGGWHGPESLGGSTQNDPAITSMAPGRLDIFVAGTDSAHSLFHRWYENGWSSANWEYLGGSLTSGPGAVSWGPGRLDVFGRGTGGDVWHKWYSGGWSGWEGLYGQLYPNTGVGAASWNRVK